VVLSLLKERGWRTNPSISRAQEPQAFCWEALGERAFRNATVSKWAGQYRNGHTGGGFAENMWDLDGCQEGRSPWQATGTHRGEGRDLIAWFSHVGIIALIDEATGYQYRRARTALEEILDRFVAKEFRKWAKRFPDDFYRELCRLRGWEYREDTVRRTPLIGKLTTDLVYDRLAPGVRRELETKNPQNEYGRRKRRHHQWLTEDVADPRLREHLASVITLMKACGDKDWVMFKSLINCSLPRYLPAPLFERQEVAENSLVAWDDFILRV
jgi:P63C domain